MESTFSSFTQVLMPHKRLWSSTVSLCCMCTCLSICLFPFDCVLCCCGCAQRAGKTVKGCKVTVESLKQATPTRPREEYCSTLFVGELPGGVTKNQIRAHFSSAGKILKVRYYEKQHHGFVYFSNNAEAKKAMALADVPFSFGKDPSTKEVVPLSWQHKLNLQYSLRTKAFDRKKAEKKANRAPPSVQNRRKAKAEERKRRKAKKGSKKTSTTKKASAAKAPKEAVPLPAEKAAPKKAAPKKK
eukprot:TRINITY_DN9752_c0_g2_i4.p1 TRINITY_DN9752_c0_g2~~TRINITY_DN9752_c0_g2_i4.p1  ORF type:complete len:243 (+),score=46.41 TRINITY_DN9752_c0_g2_i4:151-879(+)